MKMKNIKSFEGFINESIVTTKFEIIAEETLSLVNEASKVITPAEAKDIKDGIKKAIDGIKETPGVDDKVKINLVKSGIGLAVLNALAEKFGDRPATEDAKSKMKEFMTKVKDAKSLQEVEDVIFNVVDYALEVAQKTK